MCQLKRLLTTRLLERNRVSRRFFELEAGRLAPACREMAARFARGGRLLAFGAGSGITDAQHVAVEFVHPVIVGKRALPSLDLSTRYCRSLAALVGPHDIVMGFDPTQHDAEVARALGAARARGAQTFALAGRAADYAVGVVDPDPFIHQEMVEILYHVLWETVHVFLEHSALGHDAGPAAFLYPFLGPREQPTDRLLADVEASIRSKAREDEDLRAEVARAESDTIVSAAKAIHERVARGGKLLLMGNGGSATDATDWAIDCVESPKGYPPIPAVSLAADAATLSAIANDVGQESVFHRQLIAHACPSDVVVVITTSGSSTNLVAALGEARRRGLLTVALTGYGGGEIVRRELADFPIVVRCDYIPRIQEIHASVYHVMNDLVASIERPAGATP
jgi:D-sedoheptulose 7-phosphate isomerase